MKYLPWLSASLPSRRTVLLSSWITLLSTALFCASPALTAQSVSFIDAQVALQNGLVGAVVVDSADNLFIAAQGSPNIPGSNYVVELPKTPSGYGSPITLPFTGLQATVGVAVD